MVEVNINAIENRLRLRWTFLRNRYSLALGILDTKSNRVKAGVIALQIEADIESGQFDFTLAKYKTHSSENGQQVLAKDLTVGDLFDKWLDFKTTHCDQKTIQWYGDTRRNLKDFFGQKFVRSLVRGDAIAFLAWMKGSQQLVGKTIQRRIEACSACWLWGIEEGLVMANPWNNISDLVETEGQEPPDPFSVEEVSLILSGFEDLYPELVPFVRFLFGVGCRTGEAIGLRWQDISPDCSQVIIRTQWTNKKRKPTKNNKIRQIDLSLNLAQLLERLKPEQVEPKAPIFTLEGQGNFSAKAFYTRWKRVLRVQGVRYRKPYQTRHTFVSHALEKGINPVKIAAITGHNPQVLFKHYAGIIDKNQVPNLFD